MDSDFYLFNFLFFFLFVERRIYAALLLEFLIIFSRALIRESPPRNKKSFDLRVLRVQRQFTVHTRFSFFLFSRLYVLQNYSCDSRNNAIKKEERNRKNSTILVLSSF